MNITDLDSAIETIEREGLKYKVIKSNYKEKGETVHTGSGSGEPYSINIKGARPVSVWPKQGTVLATKTKAYSKTVKHKGLGYHGAIYIAVQIALTGE